MGRDLEGLLFDLAPYSLQVEPITPYNEVSDVETDVAEMLRELKRLKERDIALRAKKLRRPDGTGHLFEKLYKRNGKEYWQLWFQWRESGKMHTKYIRAHLEDKVRAMYRQGATAREILKAMGASGA